MICSICNDEISTGEHIKCKLCNEYLHFVCAGFRESVFKKTSEISKKAWVCSSCKLKDKYSPKLLAQNVVKNNDVKNNVSTFSNDTIEALVKSVEFMSEQFDIFKNQVKEIFSSLKQIQSENKLIKDQNIKLSEEVLQLNKRINSLEQRSIENNVELVGVPESSDESCVDIVKKIASYLNVEIVVHNAYRVFSGKNKNPRKIVASINSKESRHQLLTQSKKMKFKANQLHQDWENNYIYINEQMTQVNRNLFYKAKNVAREVGFKFI